LNGFTSPQEINIAQGFGLTHRAIYGGIPDKLQGACGRAGFIVDIIVDRNGIANI
jgi:hypothetical protein